MLYFEAYWATFPFRFLIFDMFKGNLFSFHFKFANANSLAGMLIRRKGR